MSDDFDLFWQAYPRKANKGDARKAWIQTATIRPPLEILMAAVEEGKRSVQWHKADSNGIAGAFIPYPASWLRAEGWENEYTIRLPAVNSRPVESAPLPPPPTEAQKEEARRLMREFRLKSV